MSTNVEPEVWTKEALASLLGTCDGYIHAIVALKLRIGQMNYHPIDKRHVRRIAQREATVRPLREMMERLEGDLRQCQAAYQEHLVRRNAATSAFAYRFERADGSDVKIPLPTPIMAKE